MAEDNSEYQSPDEFGESTSFRQDLEKYHHLIAKRGMSKKEEDQYLEMLWNMMSTFIDIAWGVDPTQLAYPNLYESIEEARNKRPDKTAPKALYVDFKLVACPDIQKYRNIELDVLSYKFPYPPT